jgi:hypothetical protein
MLSCQAIASYFTCHVSLDEKGLVTDTKCRAVIIIFSEQFIEELMTVNYYMCRRDHEARNINEDFLIHATVDHNSNGSAARSNIVPHTTSTTHNITQAKQTPPKIVMKPMRKRMVRLPRQVILCTITCRMMTIAAMSCGQQLQSKYHDCHPT